MKTGKRTSTIVFNKIKTIPHQVKLDDLNESGFFIDSVELKHVKMILKKGKGNIRWLSKENKQNQISHDFLIDEQGSIYAIYDVLGQKANPSITTPLLYLAQNMKTGEWLAVKVGHDDTHIHEEIDHLKMVCQFYAESQGVDKQFIYVMMPFVFGDKMSDLLKKPHMLQPVQLIKIAYNAMKALGKLHYVDLLHRHIQPNHLIVDVATAEVTLVDYDYAIQGVRDQNELLKAEGSRVGTKGFLAPELDATDQAHTYSEASDIYALGVTLAEWFGFDLKYDDEQLVEVVQSDRVKTIFTSTSVRFALQALLSKMTHPQRTERINLLSAETSIRKIYYDLGFTPTTDTRVAIINLPEYRSLAKKNKQEVREAIKAFDQVMFVSLTEKRVKSIEYALLRLEFENDGIYCMDQYVTFKDYSDLACHIDKRLNADAVCGYYHCCYVTTSLPNAKEVKQMGDQVICVANYKDIMDYQDDILRTYLNKIVKPQDIKRLLMNLEREKQNMVEQAARCKALNQSNIDKLTDVMRILADEDTQLTYALLYHLIGKLKRDLGQAVLTSNQPMWAPAIQERVNMTAALLDAMMPAQRLAPDTRR